MRKRRHRSRHYGDDIFTQEFTPEEIRAAVQAASDYGTYVMAHVYNDDGIRRAKSTNQ